MRACNTVISVSNCKLFEKQAEAEGAPLPNAWEGLDEYSAFVAGHGLDSHTHPAASSSTDRGGVTATRADEFETGTH